MPDFDAWGYPLPLHIYTHTQTHVPLNRTAWIGPRCPTSRRRTLVGSAGDGAMYFGSACGCSVWTGAWGHQLLIWGWGSGRRRRASVERIAQRSPSEARATDTVCSTRRMLHCQSPTQPSHNPYTPPSRFTGARIDRSTKPRWARTDDASRTGSRSSRSSSSSHKIGRRATEKFEGSIVSYRRSIEPPHHQSSHVGRSGGQQQPPTGVRLGAGPGGAAGAGPGGGGSIPSDPLTTDCLRV